MKQTFRASERFEHGLVPKCVLAALHDEGKPVVDALMSLLLRFSQKKKNTRTHKSQLVNHGKKVKNKKMEGKTQGKIVRSSFRPPSLCLAAEKIRTKGFSAR